MRFALLLLMALFTSPPLLAQKKYSAYLFTYFTGNRKEQEAIHFEISKDGYTFSALNNNKPILSSQDISESGGVRDPHILRGSDAKFFYMVVTDMVSSTDGTRTEEWCCSNQQI